MIKKITRAKRVLTFDQQVLVLSKLTVIADNQEILEKTLIDHGFSAFRPWQEYLSSFCEKHEEDKHKIYMREEAKIWLGSPDGLPGLLTGDDCGYVSPIISEMRRDRDRANGKPYSEIKPPHTWQRYIDPCMRRLERRGIDGDPLVKLQREEMDRQRERLRVDETRRHGSVDLKRNKNDPDNVREYAAVYLATLERALRPLGFCQDNYRSREYFPVVSKPISQYWDLCWSPSSEQTLRYLSRSGPKGGDLKATHDLCLYICSKQRYGPIDIPIGFEFLDFMKIKYDRVVPGFSGAYYTFLDLQDLETVITAHTTLYGLMSEFIEKTLSVELNSIDG